MKDGDKLNQEIALRNLKKAATIRDILATTPNRTTHIDMYIRVDHYDNPESIIWGDVNDETVGMWRCKN